MTYRLPFGGNTTAAVRTLLVLGACVSVLFALQGCGGGGDYDEPEPRYHDMTIILNVSDFDGDALGEVTVWVNGVAQAEKTSWQFVTLGDGYPESWQGHRANWIKGGFTVATYGAYDVATVEVIVSKTGYYTQATEFDVSDDLPSEVYARDTFIMEPAPHVTTAEIDNPRKKAAPGEVIGASKSSPRATSMNTASMYRVAMAPAKLNETTVAG